MPKPELHKNRQRHIRLGPETEAHLAAVKARLGLSNVTEAVRVAAKIAAESFGAPGNNSKKSVR